MSKSPFPNIPPATADNEAPVAPLRRLQSPAERFRAGEDGRAVEVSPFDEEPSSSQQSQQPGLNAEGANQSADAELEPLAPAAPDPFEHLPESRPQTEPRGKRGAESRRARRRLKQHAPHYHEKKPHAVTHKPIKPSAQAEPTCEWDKAAQNSMARAALARKKGRVRRIVSRIALASGVLLTVWGVGTALTAPQFNVNRVEITGAQRTSPQKVQSLTHQLVGQNVFLAPKSRIESELKAIPIVADAHIARAWSWPPHMKVQIAERQPLLQVGSGTTWWVADAQGVAFRRADRNDSDLEMLTSPELKPVIGKTLPAAQWKRARQLEEALAADNALAARESGGSASGVGQRKFWDLRRVYLDENSAAALRVSATGALKQHGETLIRLGEEGWPEKLKQARVALAFFERTGRKASELDLVSSEHPRWRPKAEATPAKPEEARELETTQD